MNRYFILVVKVLLLVQVQDAVPTYGSGIGRPAYASDGRLAFALSGNIWVVHLPVDLPAKIDAAQTDWKWQQVTTGLAEDRDPVWLPDGQGLIFSSNRNGSFDLWRVEFGRDENSDPAPVVQSPNPLTQPTLAPDGTLVWVEGFGPDANLWIKKPETKSEPLTAALGAEHTPVFSPDGSSIAYVAVRKGRHQLRLLRVSDRSDTLITGEDRPEYPSWSPSGARLAFTTRGQRPGVWITTPEGLYRNLVSTVRAAAAWSPDGRRLALAPLPRNAPAYNGDPSQIAPRVYDPEPMTNLSLKFVKVPEPPDTESLALPVDAPRNRGQFLERYDRVVNYLTQRYDLDADPQKEEWQQLKAKHRSAAQAATGPKAVEDAIYSLLRERPFLRKEAKGRAAISSAHPLATKAGLDILEKGGNVVDAAVAVSFALGVVEPDASGLGGYGEMLVFLQGMEAPTCIEFLTRVPEAASLNNGALSSLPKDGPKLANVPGTVAGMELAWRKYGSGTVEWAELIAPAVKLAKDGFVLDDAFPTTLAKEKERFLQYESSKALFFPSGVPLQEGDRLQNSDLAWALQRIAKGGAKAFYKGEIAKRMIHDLRGKGNAMTLKDLARYYAVERTPVMTTYRGHTVYSGPPPVSGGAALVAKLNLLENWESPKPYRDDAATLHAMIEAWKLAPSTDGRIADPGLWPVDLKPFVDKRLAGRRWQSCFEPQHAASPQDRTCLSEQVAAAWGDDGSLAARSSTGTTAFVVADAEGNMVSVTQTLGTWGGTFYVTPGLGFLYNDKLRSYRSDPERYNARIPFARNVTSIAPTMVFKGTDETKQPFLAVGAAGNAWITSAVYQIVAGVVDLKLGPQAAIEQPRFLVAIHREPENREKIKEIVVKLEDGFAPTISDLLRQMGHELQQISLRGELRMGYASAAIIQNGHVRAGADPRRSGQAGAVK